MEMYPSLKQQSWYCGDVNTFHTKCKTKRTRTSRSKSNNPCRQGTFMCEYFVNIPTSFSASSPISKSNGCWWLPKDCLKCKLLKRTFFPSNPKTIFLKKATFHPLKEMYAKGASQKYKCLYLQVLLRVSTLPVSRPAAAIKLMARVFGRVGQILWQCNLTHSGRLSNQLDRLEDQELEGGGAQRVPQAPKEETLEPFFLLSLPLALFLMSGIQ